MLNMVEDHQQNGQRCYASLTRALVAILEWMSCFLNDQQEHDFPASLTNLALPHNPMSLRDTCSTALARMHVHAVVCSVQIPTHLASLRQTVLDAGFVH